MGNKPNRLLVINDHEAETLARKIVIELAGNKLISHEQIEEAMVMSKKMIMQMAVEKNNRVLNLGVKSSAP